MRPGDVVFLIQAAYYLDDALAVAEHLQNRGRRVSMVAPEPLKGIARRYLSSSMRFREIAGRAAELGLSVGNPIRSHEVARRCAALVTRNDWGRSRALIDATRRHDRPVVGWVEGVHDFDDHHSPLLRNAYGNVDVVFCLGQYDSDVLSQRADVRIVGSERLWKRWHGPPTTGELPLLANVNFTYGVLTRERGHWTRGVRNAAHESGLPLVITRHPADHGVSGRRLDHTPGGSDRVIGRTARMVSRFSTLMYEALTLGIQVTYYNPHGERFPTFLDPLGAYDITSRPADLALALTRPLEAPEQARLRATPFLQRHLYLGDIEPSRLAAQQIIALAD